MSHSQLLDPPASFADRRNHLSAFGANQERRQFGNSHSDLSPPGRELACAIDRYKLMHRRRFITCDELLSVITDLGYAKQD